MNLGLGHDAQRIERAPWSERCLDVGRGKRVTCGDGKRTQGLKLCCLWTHCERWQISCTHYIHVGSGPGEGLEAWRRLHKRWGPLTTGRARGLLREILPLGRAKLGELQGAVERLDVKISSQRTRATLPTPTVTVGRVSETERKSRLPRGSKRIRCTQTGSSCEGSSGQRRPYGCWRVRTKGRPTSKGKGKNPTGKGKEQEKMVLSHQDNRTRKRFKVSVGIARKQVINRRIVGQGHSSNRTKDNRILLEKETI